MLILASKDISKLGIGADGKAMLLLSKFGNFNGLIRSRIVDISSFGRLLIQGVNSSTDEVLAFDDLGHSHVGA